MNLRLLSFAAVTVGVALATHSGAAVAASGGGLTTGNFNIETDESHYNMRTGDFTMPHHVHFTRPGTDVTGDSASGNSQRGTLTIVGHVVLHQTGPISGVSSSQKISGEPSTLTTDQLSIDSKAKQYVATGSVHFTQGTRNATAQKGTLNENTHLLDLEGDVHIADRDQKIDAQSLQYNTLTEEIDAHGAPIIMTAPIASPPPGIPKPTKPPKRR